MVQKREEGGLRFFCAQFTCFRLLRPPLSCASVCNPVIFYTLRNPPSVSIVCAWRGRVYTPSGVRVLTQVVLVDFLGQVPESMSGISGRYREYTRYLG